MSRKLSSWSDFRGRGRGRPQPLLQARLERRLRTEAEASRAPLPAGLARRTLDAVQSTPSDRTATAAFFRAVPASAALSFAGFLVLAMLVASSLTDPAGPPVARQPSSTLAFPSARALQDEAMASMRRIERLAGFEFNGRELPDPLTAEARALLRDASRAADAIMASMPRRPLQPGEEPRQSG